MGCIVEVVKAGPDVILYNYINMLVLCMNLWPHKGLFSCSMESLL